MRPLRPHSNFEPLTSNLRLFTHLRTPLHSRSSQLLSLQLIPHSLPKTPGGGELIPLSSDNNPSQFTPPESLTSLECAVLRFQVLTALECAVTKTGPPKSFGMRSCKKKGGCP